MREFQSDSDLRAEQARAIAPYAPDDTGASSVVLPQRCAQAKAADRCCLFIDHHRHRKTGPCFRLAVVGCSRHPLGGRYTLYPLHYYKTTPRDSRCGLRRCSVPPSMPPPGVVGQLIAQPMTSAAAPAPPFSRRPRRTIFNPFRRSTHRARTEQNGSHHRCTR